MFGLNEAKKRIKSGDKMFIGYYENNIIGYCWWKQLNQLEYYLYNLFIESDLNNRNYGGTDLLYLIIKNHIKGTVTSYIDEWNYKSQRIVEKLGFTKI